MSLRTKLLIILGVIGLSVWGFYPPDKKINLGLDLKGGVHLVLRVHTDDALRHETELTAERLRAALAAAKVQVGKVEAVSPTEIRVEGVQNDQAFRAAADIETTFTRSSGAGSYTYTMRPSIVNQLREEAVNQTLQTIERRVNELGVAEPIVARHGAADQILVQLPGVSDVNRAKEIIRSTAQLELKLVEQGPFPTREAALQAYANNLPPDLTITPGSDEGQPGGTPATVYYVVKKVPAVAGRELRSAQQSLDEFNQPAVSFTLKQDAAVRFGQFTQANIGRRLAIVLDDRVMSAPTIQGRITDNGQITNVTREEMQDLVITLKSGALPASSSYLEERTVGPSLGADSIRAGVTAALGGLVLVLLFMLFYYRLAGLNALTSIVVNLLILLGMMAYFGATMTLPGIAGFILTIGMGVDSNVLIFERIKEELATAKGVRSAVNAGFDRVWWTIVDTHVASLIAAAFLFQFGTGPIRGFATTLFIGLMANVFTAVFVSRTVFELVLSRRHAAGLSIGRTQFFDKANYNFIRWKWQAIALSLVVITAGAVQIAMKGLPLGIDFAGGTNVVAKFERAVSEEDVRRAVTAVAKESVVQTYGDPADREILIKLPQTKAAEQGTSLEQGARQVVEALQKAGLPKFEVVSTEIVGPVIGAELQRKGIYATIASIVGIALYIALRFRPSFAIGAIVATLHDVLVTIAFLTFFGYEISLNVVAAILTITGYSVNDTIVIFDRVRENLRSMRKDPLEQVVNLSVNQTLSRTIITAGTTFLAVLSLYLFGGEVLRGFAFTMLVGIVSGTYSTVFIAAAIAIILSQRKRRTPAAAAADAATRPARKGGRARAS